MKTCLCCMSAVFLIFSACISYQPGPGPIRFVEMKGITIVAVEATPANRGQGSGWVFVGPAYPAEGEGDLSFLSSAVSHFSKELEEKGAGVASGTGGETWSPARALAKEAASLISSDSAMKVFVREAPLRLPPSAQPSDRDALRVWYRENSSALGAKEFEGARRFPVLEIGLFDFSWVEDRLHLQILAKMVDPLSGEVKARSQGRASAWVGSPETLFLHGGERFKAVFAAAGRDLLERNLQDMGILPQKTRSLH